MHDDVIKWKHFPRYWPFVWGIHWSPVNYPHKGRWRGVLMFSLACAWINRWVNNREAGDLRRHRAHYDVIVMVKYLHPGKIGGYNYPRPDYNGGVGVRIWISNYIPHKAMHDDVIKWKHFPRYWPFVRRIHRSKASNAELWCFLWSASEQTAQ